MASVDELKKMAASVAAVAGAGNSGHDIEITRVNPDPAQPRKTFDEASLRELATSLATEGLVYPVIVHRVGAKYMIVDGERRYRAAKILGWEKIKCIVIKGDGNRLAAMQLILNVERAEISPVEQAKFVLQMMTRLGINQTELAQRLRKPKAVISKIMTVAKYFNRPPPGSAIPRMVENGRLVGMSVIYEAILTEKSSRANNSGGNLAGSKRMTREELAKGRGAATRRRGVTATTPPAITPAAIKLEIGTRVQCAVGKKGAQKKVAGRVIRLEKTKSGDLLITISR